LFGGFVSGSRIKDILKLTVNGDQGSWEELEYSGEGPVERNGHVIMGDESQFYLFGG